MLTLTLYLSLEKAKPTAQADATGPGGNDKTGRYYYGTDFDTIDMSSRTRGGSTHCHPR